MKKLFEKDQVWFAVMWIILYVVSFSFADGLSESLGTAKLLTVPVGLLLTLVLYGFVRKNQLEDDYGLCRIRENWGKFLYFIPLMVISSVNFWNGVTWNTGVTETVLYILSMCFVGILEELIFRGLLFRGMARSHVTSAIIVSSLTFGMGHIVNLLNGAPLVETLLQLVYASAIGFCYTAVFYVGGSIVPCILSHIVVNSTSIFAVEGSTRFQILTTVVQTILGVGYGLWLLRGKNSKHSAINSGDKEDAP